MADSQMDSTASMKRRLHCNKCNRHTWHNRRAEFEHKFDSGKYEEMKVDFAYGEWSIWQCAGCDEVSFLQSFFVDGDEEPTETWFPERMADSLVPRRYRNIPHPLNSLYVGVVECANRGLYLFAAIGLRSLLEGICADKGIKGGVVKSRDTGSGGVKSKRTSDLQGKIEGLTEIMPLNIVKNLHALRFLGNRAVHELKEPRRDDVLLAIEVMQDVLNVAYDLDYNSTRLLHRVQGKDSLARAIDSTLIDLLDGKRHNVDNISPMVASELVGRGFVVVLAGGDLQLTPAGREAALALPIP